MSAPFRAKLVQEIKDNVAGRLGGQYFDYVTVKVKRDTYKKILQKKLEKQMDKSTELSQMSEIPLTGDWKKIGDKVKQGLPSGETGRAHYQLIKGTRISDTMWTFAFKRRVNKTGNIEKSSVAKIKQLMKEHLEEVAIEYVHGKTGTGQFDSQLFRKTSINEIKEGLRQGDRMKGAQGTNVDQAIAKAIGESTKEGMSSYIEVFGTIIEFYKELFDYDTDLHSVISKGQFKKSILMQGVLDTKLAADNRAEYDEAIKEHAIEFLEEADGKMATEIFMRMKKGKKNFGKGIGAKKFLNLWSASPDTRDQIDKLVKANIIGGLLNFKHNINPDMRLKVNKKLLAEGQKVIGTKSSKTKAKRGKKSFRTTHKRFGSVAGAREKAKQKLTPKVGIELKELINNVLPEAVAAKMHPPALQFRTGRFANSAEVTNVMIGPRGGTEIQYTYQRDPYETFEPGNKQGSVQRDPRRIIGSTVREIAQQMVGQKFVRTRRV
jgi:hypothetical protein|tara:strand:- start:4544 stop:6016 length:1473 start_codon:yes stop_codon:yes gene_type:complete